MADGLGEPEIVAIGGVPYKVTGFVIEIQQAFERMMEHFFLNLIKNNKDALGADYLPMLQKYLFEQKNGHYKFYSPHFFDFVKVEDNFIELMHWCFSKYQPVDKSIIEQWVKDKGDEAVELFNRWADVGSKKN